MIPDFFDIIHIISFIKNRQTFSMEDKEERKHSSLHIRKTKFKYVYSFFKEKEDINVWQKTCIDNVMEPHSALIWEKRVLYGALVGISEMNLSKDKTPINIFLIIKMKNYLESNTKDKRLSYEEIINEVLKWINHT